MRVLIVCSSNRSDGPTPFIREQVDALARYGIDIEYNYIMGKGVTGYLNNYRSLCNVVCRNDIDLVHAHYGLSGMLAVLQRICPVVITFHGSDIHIKSNRMISKLAASLAAHSIFVADKLQRKLKIANNASVIPCGVDFDVFYPRSKRECRKMLNLPEDKPIILFAASFDRPVKNYTLARQAADKLGDITLIELKGYSREQVNCFLNASDLLLMTSLDEGSPQIVKEALACNCPVVSTDVGDVRQNLQGITGCYITSYDVEDVAAKVRLALQSGKIAARAKIRHFDNELISSRIIEVYHNVSKNNNKIENGVRIDRSRAAVKASHIRSSDHYG
jgi:glycosyltransferase involved in cell wall biosynthesis